MSTATVAQIKMLQSLRHQHNMPEDAYRAMIAEASNGRTSSTAALTQSEAFGLIDSLVDKAPGHWKQRNMAMDKMRKKIIGYAREMGWFVPGDLRKVDMERLNGWCRKYGFGKKGLNAYSYEELPKLVTQFETGPYYYFLKNVK
jgi:hypothetical protein